VNKSSELKLCGASDSIVDGVSEVLNVGRVQTSHADTTIREKVDVVLLDQHFDVLGCLIEIGVS